jgi:hypothetical protein
LRLKREVWDMKKIFVSFLLLALWLCLDRPLVWAVDVGWMQQGVRVWYFGAAGSQNAEEAYLFSAVNGTTVQVTKHSGVNYWGSVNPVDTGTYSFLDKGPCWIHPQVLQNLHSGDTWKGQVIATVLRNSYTYDTLKAEFSLPYLLLPIKTLFDLQAQRDLVKIVYYIDQFSTGIAYFDMETGLLLIYENSSGFVTIYFILSEINYDFATHQAFAEDSGPHTGFKSTVTKTTNAQQYLMMQSMVETRYGNTVQMWVSTSAGGTSSYLPANENYCFFGGVPVLRHKGMTDTPQYPPENWTEYGDYLWWWVPTAALQSTTIDVFSVPMTRTSTNPYTFTATGVGIGLYFSSLVFDNNGYMTDFSASYPAKGLTIPLGPSASPSVPIHLVDGAAYYSNTMGNATPQVVNYHLALSVVSDTDGKGGGSVHGDGDISCDGHGSSASGMSGNCQADFPSGTSVNLTQMPDSDSTWAAWSVAGCVTNLSCQVQMNGAKNVTVTFPYSPMARVDSTNYHCDSLALAYGNAASVDTIFGRAVTFPENFTLISSKAITLLGGRDAWYQPLNAWTTLQGILTVQSGSLTVEKLIID